MAPGNKPDDVEPYKRECGSGNAPPEPVANAGRLLLEEIADDGRGAIRCRGDREDRLGDGLPYARATPGSVTPSSSRWYDCCARASACPPRAVSVK